MSVSDLMTSYFPVPTQASLFLTKIHSFWSHHWCFGQGVHSAQTTPKHKVMYNDVDVASSSASPSVGAFFITLNLACVTSCFGGLVPPTAEFSPHQGLQVLFSFMLSSGSPGRLCWRRNPPRSSLHSVISAHRTVILTFSVIESSLTR